MIFSHIYLDFLLEIIPYFDSFTLENYKRINISINEYNQHSF